MDFLRLPRFGDLAFNGFAGFDALRLSADDVCLAGVLIALFDQQPIVLVVVPTSGLHANQRPPAFELFAVQMKLEPSFPPILNRIAFGRPPAAVPQSPSRRRTRPA